MRLAELQTESSDGVVIARVDGEIDLSNANTVRVALLEKVTNEVLGLVIDLTDVRYLDSAGIQIVYELSRRLKSRGQELRLVVRPGSLIARTLDIVKAQEAIGIVETTDAALAAVRAGNTPA